MHIIWNAFKNDMYQTQDGDVTLIMDDERVEDKIWLRSLFVTELKQF